MEKGKNGSKKSKKGSKYSCGVCGMSVVVDEVCGCAQAHEIICCGAAMKAKSK
jgi:hypothetical protein